MVGIAIKTTDSGVDRRAILVIRNMQEEVTTIPMLFNTEREAIEFWRVLISESNDLPAKSMLVFNALSPKLIYVPEHPLEEGVTHPDFIKITYKKTSRGTYDGAVINLGLQSLKEITAIGLKDAKARYYYSDTAVIRNN